MGVFCVLMWDIGINFIVFCDVLNVCVMVSDVVMWYVYVYKFCVWVLMEDMCEKVFEE